MINSKIRRSVRQERATAKDLGGRRVVGSGNQPGLKGDVKTLRWLVENKQTVASSFSLKLGIWQKIEREAVIAGKLPVIVVDIAGRSLAVIDYEMFKLLGDY